MSVTLREAIAELEGELGREKSLLLSGVVKSIVAIVTLRHTKAQSPKDLAVIYQDTMFAVEAVRDLPVEEPDVTISEIMLDIEQDYQEQTGEGGD